MPGAIFDLHYLNELIEQRRTLHGGYQGAPPVVNGYRQGQSINRSCILMLSALLQTFVEDVFVECSLLVLPNLQNSIGKYRKSFERWGNPNDQNINQLFARLGVEKVLAGLSWQHTPETAVAAKLKSMNEIRNQIAHGKKDLVLNNQSISLSLAQVERYQSFSNTFASRFEAHAKRKVLNN